MDVYLPRKNGIEIAYILRKWNGNFNLIANCMPTLNCTYYSCSWAVKNIKGRL